MNSLAGAGGATGGAGGGAGGRAGRSGADNSTAGDQGVAYERECRGNSLDCADPSLRCLGIRDATGVAGYACANQCRSASDCQHTETTTGVQADCIEFVHSKHCLLVCQRDNSITDCPAGMGCYVYPGLTIGYCLWM
jgi:hypothetical protein